MVIFRNNQERGKQGSTKLEMKYSSRYVVEQNSVHKLNTERKILMLNVLIYHGVIDSDGVL